MIPPIVKAIEQHADAAALLGDRVYPAGDAPAIGEHNFQTPYATWQTIYGVPGYCLGRHPDGDEWIVQVYVWSEKFSRTDEAVNAIRDAIDAYPGAYISAWRGEVRDEKTRLYGYLFEAAFAVDRN